MKTSFIKMFFVAAIFTSYSSFATAWEYDNDYDAYFSYSTEQGKSFIAILKNKEIRIVYSREYRNACVGRPGELYSRNMGMMVKDSGGFGYSESIRGDVYCTENEEMITFITGDNFRKLNSFFSYGAVSGRDVRIGGLHYSPEGYPY